MEKNNLALLLNLDYEKQYFKEGFQHIVGIDEVGIGCLAGPVVASAYHVNLNHNEFNLIEEVNDSKKLSEKQRDAIYEHLININHGFFGIGIATVEEIEEINILQASYLAMQRAFQHLKAQNNQIGYDLILIDGRSIKNKNLFEIPFNTIIKGDASCYSIACASIVAKVTRDRLMRDLAKEYPCYQWEHNAGYGTKKHLQAIEQFGISPYHRKTYAPIQEILNKDNQSDLF